MIFFFVRHGETNYNVDGLANDNPAKNVYLTPRGIEQAKVVADKLKYKKFEIIFVSELNRTMETAAIINQCHNAPIRVDQRINDRKTGFDGKPVKEFYKAMEKDIFNTKINDGESFQEEKERLHSFINDLKKLSHDSVLIVTHGEPLKIIHGYFENLTDSQMYEKRFDNAEIFETNI